MPGPGSRRGRVRRGGFTLTELLVVVLIVLLVSAATLPAVVGALSNRQVLEAARILQAALAGARDAAIRANAPRGIRLLPELTTDPTTGRSALNLLTGRLVSSRIIAIEPAPDITDGFAMFPVLPDDWPSNALYNVGQHGGNQNAVYPDTQLSAPLLVLQAYYKTTTTSTGTTLLVPNPPTNWFWNVRVGDKFRFSDTGRTYTVAGPMSKANPEGYVNDGDPGSSTVTVSYSGTSPPNNYNEYLLLVNGSDDNSDGYVDNGLDGIDENQDGLVDNMVEWELESWLGPHLLMAQTQTHVPMPYTITRRPVPSPGAREMALPAGAVVDLTTTVDVPPTAGRAYSISFAFQERSRLPVDPSTGYVDILMNQAGQVIPTTYYSTPASAPMGASFYHFWVADRSDVFDPVLPTDTSRIASFPALPMPTTTDVDYLTKTGPGQAGQFLTKDRQLVTLFAKTGHVVTNSIESFDVSNVNRPYTDAQLGAREAK
jgi:prepilin-type N-terminal cleavage/methylation domain-containing protein